MDIINIIEIHINKFIYLYVKPNFSQLITIKYKNKTEIYTVNNKKKDGIYIRYYKNNKINVICNYRSGVIDGFFYKFYMNGQLGEVRKYKFGVINRYENIKFSIQKQKTNIDYYYISLKNI
jgi:antitoxin component YwqK of YwqJK toxin-antitoxin module